MGGEEDGYEEDLKLVLLDMGNVLLNIDFSRFTERAAAVSGKHANEIHERYIKGEAKKEFERGKLSETEFFDEMSEWLLWPHERVELVNLWCDIFSELTGAREIMQSITGRKMILSDTDPAHVKWFSRKFPWVVDVEKTFYSFERGLRKGDEGAFEGLLNELNVPASEILFFDDIPEHVERAKRVGINAHVFTNWNEAKTKINF